MAQSYTLAYRGTDVQRPVLQDSQGFLQSGLTVAPTPKGTVTQLVSNSTDVTIDAIAGKVTMFGTLASGAGATFTVNNRYVSQTSVVVTTVDAFTGTPDATQDTITSSAINITNGAFKIHVFNPDALVTAAAPDVSFIVSP